ncbi:MAG: hypothetical protein ACNFW9_02015 [Candidatus Kerfeldbacteria bacterium]
MLNDEAISLKKQKIKYWIYMVIFWALGILLSMFVQDLLYGWGNPRVITSFTHIKSRLGEVIAFGMSVVVILYSIIATALLIYGSFKPGLKKLNYRGYSKAHSLVLFALIFYTVLFMVFFYKF